MKTSIRIAASLVAALVVVACSNPDSNIVVGSLDNITCNDNQIYYTSKSGAAIPQPKVSVVTLPGIPIKTALVASPLMATSPPCPTMLSKTAHNYLTYPYPLHSHPLAGVRFKTAICSLN